MRMQKEVGRQALGAARQGRQGRLGATALSWLTALGLGTLGLGALVLLASQLHCAEAEVGWRSDDPGQSDLPGGGDGGLDDGGGVQCFTGTATTEPQLLNHCTEAEHVDRPTHIPTTTWDGKSPLP